MNRVGTKMLAIGLIGLVLGTAGVTVMPFLQRTAPSPLDTGKQVLAFYYNWYLNTTSANFTNATTGIIDTGDRGHGWGADPALVNWTHVHQFQIPTTEEEVLNNTFTWDKSWMNTAHFPEWGHYHSGDPAVMRRDLLNAAYCGVDTFIMTWWGPGNTYIDMNLVNMMNYALYMEEVEGITGIPNFTIYFEHSRDTWPIDYPEREEAIIDEYVHVLENYATHPKFFKVNDIPVIFLWATINKGSTIDRWAYIVQQVKERAGPVYIHAAISYGQKGVDESTPELYARVFDGFHVYLTGGLINNIGEEYKRKAYSNRDLFSHYVRRSRNLGVNFATCVMPGYDDTNIPDRIGDVKNRRGTVQYGDRWTYDGMWEDAIEAGTRWIAIVSWNEWWEGTEIDASYEYGTFFIERTRYWTTRFKAG